MDFINLRLKALHVDKSSGVDLYIKVAGRYLLYIRQGDTLEPGRKARLENKGVEKLYAKKNDMGRLWENLARLLVVNEKEITEYSIETMNHIALESMFSAPLERVNYLNVESSGRATKGYLENNSKALEIILKLGSDPDIFSHSMNVAALAIQLAMHLEAPRKTVDLIGTGALLHDIGKTQKPDDYGQHPRVGADLLFKQKYIPREVLDIILFHEETIDGKGFPSGVRHLDEIFQVVGIANVYDRLLRREEHDHSRALKALVNEIRGKYADEIINGFATMFEDRIIK